MNQRNVLTELARRIERAKEQKNWRAVEIHTAAWLRVNGQTERQFEVSGLSRRLERGN